jgi:hypothetical protein
MAALLAVFAAFEREILQERVRAGLAHARQNGKKLGRPITAATKAAKCGYCTVRASARPRSPVVCRSAAPLFAACCDRKGIGMARKRRSFEAAFGMTTKDREQIAADEKVALELVRLRRRLVRSRFFMVAGG